MLLTVDIVSWTASLSENMVYTDPKYLYHLGKNRYHTYPKID